MSDDVALVVLAGGSGTRTGDQDNKVYRPIAERPILSFSIEAASASRLVDRLVVVVRPEDRDRAEAVVKTHGRGLPAMVVAGGSTRHQSEWNALSALAGEIDRKSIGVLGIHDGARPFLTTALLRSLIGVAIECGGAIPGLPLEGTIASADGRLVDTHRLRRVQTPQIFRAAPLLDAYRRAADDDFEGLDTAETVLRYTDEEVRIIDGDPRNLKVTYGDDFEMAERAARAWRGARWIEDRS